MKKILFVILCAVSVSLLSSCSKDSEGLTRVTYYATITLKGDADMVVAKGSTFTDPGCVAIMNGEDITDQVIVSSTVNTAASGVYSVTYTAVNEDGFSSSAIRSVTVLDLTNPVEGFYTTTDVHTGTSSAYNGPWKTLVIGLGNNQYSINDLFGGWYAQGRKYGTNYEMNGKFEIDGADVKLLYSHINGWGDSVDNPVGSVIGNHDAAAGTFHWELGYAGSMTFFVTIAKNN